MKKSIVKPLVAAIALALPYTAFAQVDNAELLRELQELKAKVKALEDKINGAPAAAQPADVDAAAAPTANERLDETVTATFNYLLDKNVTLRAEYRLDG